LSRLELLLMSPQCGVTLTLAQASFYSIYR
jgi:hypothetical protein